MFENGGYLAPSQIEAGFISTLHTDEIVDKTIETVMEAFRSW
jgi:glutamate-1-semialdehyde 2,1-aminomutase